MGALHKNKLLNEKRKRRIRKKVSGSASRPRLSVYRSLKHLSCQAIDDTTGRTICALSSCSKALGMSSGGNIAAATQLGSLFAEKLKSAGVETLVFDRNGRAYHGRVKAFAEALRASGIQF